MLTHMEEYIVIVLHVYSRCMVLSHTSNNTFGS